MKKFILSLGILFFTSTALAYIPPYWMIMSRTADTHGRGTFQIDQDVVFSHGQETLIVNERWIIQGEQALRLEVTGRRQLQDKLRLTYVYQNGRRYFVDENGVKKSEKISDDFFEVYFHFRFSKNIKPMLVAQKIAPAASLKSDPHRYSQKTPHAAPEPYVRLSRVGGTISYAIGTPTPSAEEKTPGIWIEQDQFLIRKLRLASGLEILANQYKTYSQNLQLPQERVVNWRDQIIKININNAASVVAGPKVKAALDNASLNFGTDPKLSRVWPEDTVIRDFYNSLR